MTFRVRLESKIYDAVSTHDGPGTLWKWNIMWLLNSLAQNSFPFLVIWRLLATGMVSNTCGPTSTSM